MNNSDKMYIEILKAKIDKNNKKIAELAKQTKGFSVSTGSNEIQIQKLRTECEVFQTEIEKVEQQTASRIQTGSFGESSLGYLDERVELKHEKIGKLQADIQELEDLKNTLKTKSAQAKLVRKIEKKQKQIKKLQESECRLGKVQRAIMMPKTKIEMLKLGIVSKQDAKTTYAESTYQDSYELQQMFAREGGFINNIKANYYEARGNYYLKKYEHASEVLNTMKQSNNIFTISGANAMVLSKKTINIFRNNLNLNNQNAVKNAATI